MVKGELYANELKIRENICSKRGPWYTLMLLGVKGGREVWDTCIMRAKDLKSQFAWLKEGELNFIQIAEKLRVFEQHAFYCKFFRIGLPMGETVADDWPYLGCHTCRVMLWLELKPLRPTSRP